MDTLILSSLVNRLPKCWGRGGEEGEGRRRKGREARTRARTYSAQSLPEDHTLIKYLWILMHRSVKSGNSLYYFLFFFFFKRKKAPADAVAFH